MILIGCAITFFFSAAVFGIVLWIQWASSSSGSWDFQGAAGAATVIPSFAGVLLAAFAIYFQIQTNAPAYKQAEASWLDISCLHQSALRIGAQLANVNTKEPVDLANSHVGPDDEAEQPIPNEFRDRLHKSRGFFLRRCAGEFKVAFDHDTVESSTFAAIAVRVFPLLDTLQQSLPVAQRVNLLALEAQLDAVGESFSEDLDWPELSAWMSMTQSALRQTINLIQLLSANDQLSLRQIEAAILSPGQSGVVTEWFEQADALEEWRLKRRPIERT